MSQRRTTTNTNKKGLRFQTWAEPQYESDSSGYSSGCYKTPVSSADPEREAIDEKVAMARQYKRACEGIDEEYEASDLETVVNNMVTAVEAWNSRTRHGIQTLEDRLKAVKEREDVAGFPNPDMKTTYERLQDDIAKLIDILKYADHPDEEMAAIDNQMQGMSLALDELERFFGIA